MSMRRIGDVLVGLLCLALASPSMIIIAVLIKRDSPGPVFYIPKMIGQHGSLFPLFRFRTMSTDLSHHREGQQRFTPVGCFIRNYSLDHLPMLINLVFGHLTLVGPRPMELAVVDVRDPRWRTYFSVKPGLVNYAVLKLGKMWTPSRATHPERNQTLELGYIQNQSWWSDIKLFVQGIYALIASKGNLKARKEPDTTLESEEREAAEHGVAQELPMEFLPYRHTACRMGGCSRRRCAAIEIGAILTAGIGPTAFPIYWCVAAKPQSVGRRLRLVASEELSSNC
jgi:lipopolysaccharide/colanic/teichoic acid biosynthesis glycosyltransferase